VTGFDDTPMSEIIWPPLTTVRQPIQYFAERAVRMLFEDHAGDSARYETIEHRLVVRQSTSPPNRFRIA
jgi:LacI family transcriptional regulator